MHHQRRVLHCLPRLGVLALLACASPAFAGPAMSRGQQFLQINHQECLSRAAQALKGAGYTSWGQMGNGPWGDRGPHSAVILCEPVSTNREVVLIVVATEGTTNADVPGAERVRLQELMNGGSSPEPVSSSPPATPYSTPYSPEGTGAAGSLLSRLVGVWRQQFNNEESVIEVKDDGTAVFVAVSPAHARIGFQQGDRRISGLRQTAPDTLQGTLHLRFEPTPSCHNIPAVASRATVKVLNSGSTFQVHAGDYRIDANCRLLASGSEVSVVYQQTAGPLGGISPLPGYPGGQGGQRGQGGQGGIPQTTALSAELECGSELELVAGGRPESCGVKVSGYRSDTRTPVEIILDPPFARSSGLRVAPGNTSQAGDALYASGVNDRFGTYVFGEGFSAILSAPSAPTTVTVIVRQGNAEVRLPLTLSVIQPGEPRGSSRVPRTPVVVGTAIPGQVPYCVWQYKVWGDAPACWHFAAAPCNSARHANRAEYQLVGTSMRRGEADQRVLELSRYHLDSLGCRAVSPEEPPIVTPQPTPQAPAPTPAPTVDPYPTPGPSRPTSRLSRFGIDPRDLVMRVGDTATFRAWGSYIGSRDMVMEIPVTWSGDKPPVFTATAADAGRTYRITATGPAGETDTVTVRVEAGPRPTGTPWSTPPPTGTETRPAAAGTLARTGAAVIMKDVEGRFGYQKFTLTSCVRHDEEGPNNVQDFIWTFSGVPESLEPGREYTITASGGVKSIPASWKPWWGSLIHLNGLEMLEDVRGRKNPDGGNDGRFRIRLVPGAKSAFIGLACDPGATFATYNYGAK
jgi:hypothetical protein